MSDSSLIPFPTPPMHPYRDLVATSTDLEELRRIADKLIALIEECPAITPYVETSGS